MWYACFIAVADVSQTQKATSPIELSKGIKFEPVPEWVKDGAATYELSVRDRKFVENSVIVLSTEYEGDGVESSDQKGGVQAPESTQKCIEEKFALANIAFWLTKPSPLTFGPTLHFSEIGNPNSLRREGVLKHVRIGTAEHKNHLSRDEVLKAGQLLKSIVELQRSGPVWQSIRTLISALEEKTWDIRYLLLWIVLETIFGPDDGELSHQIAQRAAFLLGSESNKRRKIFLDLKKGYGWRSKIVHGASLEKLSGEQSLIFSERAEFLIRKTLCKILCDEDLKNSINGKRRNEFFNGLLFQ